MPATARTRTRTPTRLSYAWDLDGNNKFGEAGETGEAPAFSALGLDRPRLVAAARQVTDAGGLSNTAFTTIRVLNAPPVVDAGADFRANEGDHVRLHGTATDPGGDALSYQWLVSPSHGFGFILFGQDVPFSPADDETYTATLTVRDDDGAFSSDTVVVTGTTWRRSHP